MVMGISVIIPTKDRLPFLRKVLPTYVMQKEVKEIIVVVDGSTDGTLEFLKMEMLTNSKLKYLDNGINRGIPFSKNRGIDAALYQYIFIGEDDLELTDNFLSILLAHKQKTNADIICGRNIFRYDHETSDEAIKRTNKMNGDYVSMKTIEINTSLRLSCDSEQPIIASPMLAETSIFERVRFDEMYKVNFWREETDFQVSARKRGYTLFSCPHAICFNFIIQNDRGGAHASVGFRRARYVIINNWKFISKHRDFIQRKFQIGNPYIYIIRFAIKRINIEVLAPKFGKFKGKLLRSK